MAKIKKLKQNNEDLYPITHEDAVFDSDGVSIGTKINNLEDDMINLVDIGEIEDIENSYTQIEMEVLENVSDNVNINGKSIIIKEIRGNTVIENGNILTVENDEGLKINISNPDDKNLFYFDNVGYETESFKVTGPNSIKLSPTSGRGDVCLSNVYIKVEPNTQYITCYDSVINEDNTSFVCCYDENYNILENLEGIGTYVPAYKGYIQTKDVVYNYNTNVSYIRLGFRAYPLLLSSGYDDVHHIENLDFYDIYNIGFYKANHISEIQRIKSNNNSIELNYLDGGKYKKICSLNKLNDDIYDRIYYNGVETIYEKNCELYRFNGTEKIIEADDFSSNENIASFFILINKRISAVEELNDNNDILCNRFDYINGLSGKNEIGVDYLSISKTKIHTIGTNIRRGICLHINKSELSEVSTNGMVEKIKEWYNEGNPLTIVASCDKEIYKMHNLISNIGVTNINIYSNSKYVKAQFDISIGKIKSEIIPPHALNDYAKLYNMVILSEELEKGKNMQEIFNENKRIIVDKKFYIESRIKLTGSSYKIMGLGTHTGFTQIGDNEPVFHLGEPDNAFTTSTISNLAIIGTINEYNKSGDGILVDFAHGVEFNKLDIMNNGGCGVRGVNESAKNGLWIAQFIDCNISYNYDNGVYFSHSNETQFNDILFDKCRIGGNGYVEIDGQHKSAYSVKQVLEDRGHGCDISGTGIKIVNGDIEGNAGAGIKINGGYASGITITGLYLEPNLLTNIYVCKDGMKENIFINGNYFMESEDGYQKGKFYVEEGFNMNKLYGTQLYDYTDVINTSKSPIPIIVEDGTEACLVSLTEKMLNHPLNFKVTMRYKSLIEHGYMSFGMQYQCKGRNLMVIFNKDTKKSNVVNITNVTDNVVTIDTPLIPTDDTWDHITFHNHTDYTEHDYNGCFLTAIKDFVISKENLEVLISDNGLKLTFHNLSSNNLNMLKNCTHITCHKEDTSFTSNTDWMVNYVTIPVSLDRYNNVVMFNSLMEMEKFSEARLHVDKIIVWGIPHSYDNGNHHEMIDLKIEQNDTAYVCDTNELDMLIKYNQMRIYIIDKCTYVTYLNGKYYKDDGTQLTI